MSKKTVWFAMILAVLNRPPRFHPPSSKKYLTPPQPVQVSVFLWKFDLVISHSSVKHLDLPPRFFPGRLFV